MIKLFALALVGISLQGGAQQSLPPPPEEPKVIFDEPIAIDEGFALTREDRKRMELDGLRGDGLAALRLSLHFSTGMNADRDQAAYWRLIAAENGNAVAQYNLWVVDQESPDASVRARALFWLRQAALQGHERAMLELERMTHAAGSEPR